jgi:hypothetical protein
MIPTAPAMLLEGRRGLVVGIANERSIAWGYARAFRALGAELPWPRCFRVHRQHRRKLCKIAGTDRGTAGAAELGAALDPDANAAATTLDIKARQQGRDSCRTHRRRADDCAIFWLTALCVAAAPLGVVLALVMSEPSLADESGASMYLPGSFASLAAVPAEPGWSLALVYYHGKGTFGPPSVGYATERSDLGYGAPTYAFATPVLCGQLALSMVGAIGRIQASIDGVADDRRYGYNDLLPGATLRWNSGVNNYMVYGLGEIPSGTYDPLRLANFGIGHGGIDVGGGYTYFDQKAGYEFSAVAGLTYNLKNTSTEYQNGIDSHIDWGASKFLSKDFSRAQAWARPPCLARQQRPRHRRGLRNARPTTRGGPRY